MAVYKDKSRGTWYASFLYVDWTGKRCRKLKRGFATKKEAQEYDVKMEKSSLRSHLMKNNMPEDSDKAAYSRIQKYAQKYRDREADRRLENGEPMDEESINLLRGLSMDTIEEKTSGYQINDMQFFELTQLRNIRLLKAFVEHRLENSKKVSNTAFREMYEG